MDSVTHISEKLGEYMLRGWVLTDLSCPTPGCSVPLMRSPRGQTPVTHLCAKCDGTPDAVGRSINPPPLSIPDSASSISTTSQISRSSTPPTEVSSTLSSPIFAPPAETEESRQRRAQSDRASSEIGKRLLKGWAMLGDECPNARCYGIPLVRAPKLGGGKDPKKECVICGTIYLTEIDWAGRERLVPLEAGSRSDAAENNTSLSRGEVPEQAPNATGNIPSDQVPSAPSEASRLNSPGQSNALTQTIQPSDHVALPPPSPEAITSTVRFTPALEILEESALALQTTLRSLAARLTTLQTTMDPSSISLTADAIGKVTQALSQVRQLQWSESQAQVL